MAGCPEMASSRKGGVRNRRRRWSPRGRSLRSGIARAATAPHAPTHQGVTVMSTTQGTLTVTIAKQKVDLEAEYRALISGMTTVYGNVDSYALLGQVFTKADLIAKFQSRIDASVATKGARTDLHAKVAQEKAVDKEV